MRVAIDAGPLYGHRTGVGVATEGLIGALAARDDVELVPYLISRRSTPMPGHRRLPVPGIVASHVWSRFDHPRADRWLGPADVIHGTNYVVPPTRLSSVVSVYDCWFFRHADHASALVRRAGANLRRAVARGAWIHASSDATNREVRDLLDIDRVVTVALGPPAPIAHEPVDIHPELRGRRFVLAIGTEEHRKGLPLLVDAFGLLAAEHDDLQLALAGASGDGSDAVTAAIERSPARARIHRLGPVDDLVKGALLRQAAVLAYPSIDEGFGFPVLEAQTAGTPVVAIGVGSIPEVAGDGAMLVDGSDRSPERFATALAETLGGVGRLGLIEAGYRNVTRFDWATTAAEIVELYRRAADPT